MNMPRYWLNIFGVTMGFALLGVLAFTLLFTNQLAKSMLQPLRQAPPTGSLLRAEEISFEEITLTTKDGLRLAAWYTPPQNSSVILIAHGYSSNRSEDLHAMFARNGYGVLSWDFRAHGGSEGEFSTLGDYEQRDVEAALDFALAQEGVEHIGAWGGSMGAATLILSTAEHPEIQALVADSAYPSLESVMRHNVQPPFFQSFMRFWEYYSGAEFDRVNPEAVIHSISPRALFIIDSGEVGSTMSFPNRLYDAALEPRELWLEEGIPHLGMYANDPQQYEERVIEFFDMWLR